MKLHVQDAQFSGILPPEGITILEQAVPDYQMCSRIYVKDKWVNYHLHKTIGSKMYAYQFTIFNWKGLTDEQLYILRQDNG